MCEHIQVGIEDGQFNHINKAMLSENRSVVMNISAQDLAIYIRPQGVICRSKVCNWDANVRVLCTVSCDI